MLNCLEEDIFRALKIFVWLLKTYINLIGLHIIIRHFMSKLKKKGEERRTVRLVMIEPYVLAVNTRLLC